MIFVQNNVFFKLLQQKPRRTIYKSRQNTILVSETRKLDQKSEIGPAKTCPGGPIRAHMSLRQGARHHRAPQGSTGPQGTLGELVFSLIFRLFLAKNKYLIKNPKKYAKNQENINKS